MRSKTIISAIAFITAFGISLALTPRTATQTAAPLYQPKKCAETGQNITKLLEQDIQNGRIRDRKMYRVREQGDFPGTAAYHLNYAAAIAAYSNASKSIDTSKLPNEFLKAWNDHMDVWEGYADFLKQNIDSDGKLSRERSFYRAAAMYDREISETWYAVLRIAGKHGAEIPAGAY